MVVPLSPEFKNFLDETLIPKIKSGEGTVEEYAEEVLNFSNTIKALEEDDTTNMESYIESILTDDD